MKIAKADVDYVQVKSRIPHQTILRNSYKDTQIDDSEKKSNQFQS